MEIGEKKTKRVANKQKGALLYLYIYITTSLSHQHNAEQQQKERAVVYIIEKNNFFMISMIPFKNFFNFFFFSIQIIVCYF